jgi:hypothetical protein
MAVAAIITDSNRDGIFFIFVNCAHGKITKHFAKHKTNHTIFKKKTRIERMSKVLLPNGEKCGVAMAAFRK